MMRRTRSDHDAFADWLDAGQPVGSGEPAEGSRELDEAREGSVQVDALNRRFEQHANAVAPARTSLESILAAAGAQPPLGMPDHSTSSQRKEHQVASTLSHPVSHGPYRDFGPGPRLTRLVSVAAIVAIVLAGSTAAWFGRDRLGFGGGGDGPRELSYAAFVTQDGQETTVAYDVPTADDCTVEPLTVDQVMEKLSEPHQKDIADAYATAQAMYDAGTPPSTPAMPGYSIREETHAEIAAAQREWLACSLFGTPFQRWALETNRRVQQEFQQLYFPVIDMALIEQDLDDLAGGKENRLSGSTLTDGGLLPMVPSYVDGLYNYYEPSGNAAITIVWMRPDGTALLAWGQTMEDVEPFMSATSLERRLPNTWIFLQNPETGQWLLEGLELGMG